MEKCYFSIGEVSEELGIPQTTLRFWEKQFDDMPGFLCRKNEKGTRRYSQQNLQNLRTLKHLLKEQGMTIEGAKKTIKSGTISKGRATISSSDSPDTVASSNKTAILQRLVAIRDELQGLIDVYDNIIKGN